MHFNFNSIVTHSLRGMRTWGIRVEFSDFAPMERDKQEYSTKYTGLVASIKIIAVFRNIFPVIPSRLG